MIKDAKKGIGKLKTIEKKRLVCGTLAFCFMIGISIYAGLPLMGLVFGLLILCTVPVKLKRSGRPLADIGLYVLWCLASVVGTLLFSQFLISSSIIPEHFLMNMVVYLMIFSVVTVACADVRLSAAITSAIVLIFSAACYYCYQLQGNQLTIFHLMSVKTAAEVVDTYKIVPNIRNLMAICMWFVMTFTGYSLPEWKPFAKYKKKTAMLLPRGIAVGVLLLLITVYAVQNANDEAKYWDTQGSNLNGYLYNFCLQIRDLIIDEPEGYSAEEVNDIAEQYSGTEEVHETPNIIVIMDEAFTDYAGLYETEIETVTPFISSLSENTIKGYVLSSVYGGSTANSEYEFLTGNTLAWLYPNSIVYQQYINDRSYSMVEVLQRYGYNCVAMHPYLAKGWNRPAVYQYFGFDETYFEDRFEHNSLLREFISDQAMVDEVIQYYERQKDGGSPLFLFGITMQNHGGYTYSGENFQSTVDLSETLNGEYPQAEQYLSLLRETDSAVESLITYFSGLEEKTVVVFFGDHHPKLDDGFEEALNGKGLETLDEQECRYTVPFFIWANYNIEEKEVGVTSLNYLGNYMYEAAGLPLPTYSRFLSELQEKIPAINSLGYYSISNGKFISTEEAEGEEAAWLSLYQKLQYNCLFDKKNFNQTLFPVS